MIRASEGVCRLGGNPTSPSLPFEQSLLESPQNKYKIKIEIQIQIQKQDFKVLDWNSLPFFSSSVLGALLLNIFHTLPFHTWPFWHGFALMHTSVLVKLIQLILVHLPAGAPPHPLSYSIRNISMMFDCHQLAAASLCSHQFPDPGARRPKIGFHFVISWPQMASLERTIW